MLLDFVASDLILTIYLGIIFCRLNEYDQLFLYQGKVPVLGAQFGSACSDVRRSHFHVLLMCSTLQLSPSPQCR